MFEYPLVSIIIPCYNHGSFILETIDSVLNQLYSNIEIIIVNDGSDDSKTLEVLDGINHPLIQIIHQENAGPSVARNYAMNFAKGKYFIPLDADDLIERKTITNAIEVLENDPKIAVVYGDCQLFGEKNELRKQQPLNVSLQLKNNTIALCSVIRREAFLSCGGFDVFLSKKGLEDWDLWLTLYEKGWVFKYVEKTFFNIRVLSSSRTYQFANKNLEEIKSYVYKKHSDLLAEQFLLLYHENKNIKNTSDYKIGYFLLIPFRLIKRLLKRLTK